MKCNIKSSAHRVGVRNGPSEIGVTSIFLIIFFISVVTVQQGTQRKFLSTRRIIFLPRDLEVLTIKKPFRAYNLLTLAKRLS